NDPNHKATATLTWDNFDPSQSSYEYVTRGRPNRLRGLRTRSFSAAGFMVTPAWATATSSKKIPACDDVCAGYVATTPESGRLDGFPARVTSAPGNSRSR